MNFFLSRIPKTIALQLRGLNKQFLNVQQRYIQKISSEGSHDDFKPKLKVPVDDYEEVKQFIDEVS